MAAEGAGAGGMPVCVSERMGVLVGGLWDWGLGWGWG